MKLPDFSVIIPTFNRADFVRSAVESVLQQTHINFEVLIVDDGSTDNTEEVVASICDSRVKYFKKVNGERAAARNFGVANAVGSYVTFLDSDDTLKTDHLMEAKKFREQNAEAIIFHLGYDVVRSDGTIIYPWKPLPDPVNQKLMEGNYLSCMGVFIRRDIADQNRFNEDRDLSGSEDYELWVRLAARYPIRTSPVSTACLVNHDERSVLQIDSDKLSKRISLVRQYLINDEKVKRVFGARLNVLFGFHFLYEALHNAMGGHRWCAIRALLRGIGQYPSVMFNYRFWVVLKKLFWK